LYDQLAPQFRRIPGVQSVVGTTVIPALFGGGAAGVIDVRGFESAPDDEMWVSETQVMPGFFGAMKIALRGRDFSTQDVRGSEPVAIISQNMAKQFYAGRDPIGERFRWRQSNGPPTPFYRIVGVAEDVKYFDLRAAPPRMAYFPWAQTADLDERLGGRPLFAIRTAMPAAQVVRAAREIIDAALPGVRIRRDQSLSAATALALGREQALASLALIFGALAIGLAAIGLYGVLSFHVSTRRREIGVRMALGADRGRVVRMILRQSFVVIMIGAVFGVPLSLMAGRALGALLYGIPPWHPLPVLGALVILLAVGTLAAVVPSRSAARVDPLIAMRAD
jgi:predicted permease